MIVWWYGVGQYDCVDDFANKVFEDVAMVAWESLALPWAAPINQHAQHYHCIQQMAIVILITRNQYFNDINAWPMTIDHA